MSRPSQHMKRTARLARKLKQQDVYDWIMKNGYYPESYVLPPCFSVEKYPQFGNLYFQLGANNNYSPKSSALAQIQFPKSNFADRTFSIIDPEIHCDLAYEIATNWKKLLKIIFNPNNLVCCYSFPIPLDSTKPGVIGKLRSGRMIYEFIEMAENDVASEAFQYTYLVTADIKNFYPSIYSHSLAWAIHGTSYIRAKARRRNYKYLGNRIDKLFQRANDDRTNGIAIGPAVSDVVSELLLARVDTVFSESLTPDHYLAVRFKDDYRILCNSENDAKQIIKSLQSALREYNLDISEDKTTISRLPDGMFRPWVSRYHAANPNPKQEYTYKQFKEVYLSVVATDREFPGTGIVDRFLADIVTKDFKPNFAVSRKTVPNIISLLMMLASLRIKSFPKILGVIEAIMRSADHPWYTDQIGMYLANYLNILSSNERDNRYLIIWILYFLKSNRLDRFIMKKYHFKDPLVKSVQSNRCNLFGNCRDFKLYVGILSSVKRKSLLEHLDVFSPQ
jgi:hypothetical protein